MDIAKLRNIKEFLKEELFRGFKFFLLIFFVLFLFIGIKGIISKIDTKLAYKNSQAISEELLEQKVFINKPNSVLIPKIKIEVPLVFVDSTLPKDFINPLRRGVVHYPSALPGERGRIIILGHSAPPGWPRINYDWAFSGLNKLENGDEVLIFFNNNQYKYIVREKTFLNSGQEIPSFSSDNSESELLLISCWPPGINHKRIVVRAELQKT
jgi:LPXTG-site transpeptidase (sortase) family protein